MWKHQTTHPAPRAFRQCHCVAFHSLVVASSDDEYVPLLRGKAFAEAWGSEYVLVGDRGHIGSAAKLGMWPEGLALLNKLRAEVG